MQTHKVSFTRVPVGGGGLVPNLLTGNIDAAVLYAPLTFRLLLSKQARSLINFGTEVPAHSTGSWIATDKMINEQPKAVQSALNAIYGGLAWLRAPQNRDEVIKYLAKLNDISVPVATTELDESYMNLSSTGEFKKEWVERALGMASLVGMKDLAPLGEIYTTKFRPVPTTA